MPASEDRALRDALRAEILRLYELGYWRFLSGGALGFDQLAAEEVLPLRQLHPSIRLIFVLPCADQNAKWTQQQTRRYQQLLALADETVVLSPRYYDGCMMVRNRYMVDHAGQCVSYLKQQRGGTMNTVIYAMRQYVPVTNLALRTVPGNP